MSSLDDSPVVGRHEDEHLRQFVQARRRRDPSAMRDRWEAVVIALHDRLDGLVALEHRGRLNAQEHEEALARALEKVALRLLWTFEGTSMGQLVEATKTLVHGVCIDVQRKAERDRRRAPASLDDLREDAEGRRAAEHRAEAGRAEWDRTRAQERREARDFLDWALDRLDPRQRRVLEMTRDGAPLEEVMAELDVKRDNAYKLRERGLKALGRLKEEYDA